MAGAERGRAPLRTAAFRSTRAQRPNRIDPQWPKGFGLNRVRADGAALDAPALAANSAATARVGPGSAAEVSIMIGPGQAPASLPAAACNAALLRGEVDVPMWMMAYFTTSAAVKKGAGQSPQAHVKLIAREGGFSVIAFLKILHGN